MATIFRRGLCAAIGSLLCIVAVHAADLTEAQARYRQELAACEEGSPDRDREACRLEARNALTEIRRGRMDSDDPALYQQNAMQRCQVHAQDERAACEARMRGEGRVEGSVEGGGLLRQIEQIVPARQLPP